MTADRPAPSPGPRSWSSDQDAALSAFHAFLGDPAGRVFVVSGAAGTGKTTLMSAMVSETESRRMRLGLAALTGRAATIATERVGRDVMTLHSHLYQFNSRASRVVHGLPRLVFSLRDSSDDPTTVLFVDEVSMLAPSDQGASESIQFGSGNLAADLLRHVFGQQTWVGGGPKLVLVGDPYQLPPVGDPSSVVFDEAAWDTLARDAIGGLLPTTRVALSTVHRQREGGILELATQYREALIRGDVRTTPRLAADDQEVTVDVTDAGGSPGRDAEVAADPTVQVIICNTNVGALAWNRKVRRVRWGDADSQVLTGDVLVNTRRDPRTGLANGELLEVMSADLNCQTVAHLGREVRLRPVRLRAVGTEVQHECLLADNALQSEERTISADDLQVLWVDFAQRHRELRESTPEYWDKAFRDPILNPIVAKYGYAITCHKAQGGQWSRVIVDFNKLHMRPDSVLAFRWSYTAITRAKEHLVLIDPPRLSPVSRIARSRREDSQFVVLPVDGQPQTAAARRTRVEDAVASWAQAAGVQLQVHDPRQYYTRFTASRAMEATTFDLYFDREGLVSRTLVPAGGSSTEGLVPPFALLERAVFQGAPRPADLRINDLVTVIEGKLRADGLMTDYRQQLGWSVELGVGSEDGQGVLVLPFRKSGSLGPHAWKRAADSDTQERVGRILEQLANG